jgi:hypothetical protein
MLYYFWWLFPCRRKLADVIFGGYSIFGD